MPLNYTRFLLALTIALLLYRRICPRLLRRPTHFDSKIFGANFKMFLQLYQRVGSQYIEEQICLDLHESLKWSNMSLKIGLRNLLGIPTREKLSRNAQRINHVEEKFYLSLIVTDITLS